jgi:hypothetical protein
MQCAFTGKAAKKLKNTEVFLAVELFQSDPQIKKHIECAFLLRGKIHSDITEFFLSYFLSPHPPVF